MCPSCRGPETMDARIPVTVVTGYLGAGKTSLVNHLIATSGRKLAVIVNEFGDIGIDGALIDSGEEELIELNSGCICCVIRGDLVRTLRGLLRRGGFEGIVIETTGLANPGPVIQTFYADQHLAAQCRLDAVITVVDALHIAGQLRDSQDAADQVALASVIVLNKSSETDCTGIEAALQALNPFAPCHRSDRGQVDPSQVLDTRGFDLDRVTLPETSPHQGSQIKSVSLTSDQPMDAQALEQWLTHVLATKGQHILRTKGIVWLHGEPRKLVIQAVHMLMEGDQTTPWDSAAPHNSRLVFIGRGLDAEALSDGFLSCRAPVHV